MSLKSYALYNFLQTYFDLPSNSESLHLDITAPAGGDVSIQTTLVEAAVKVAEKVVASEVEAAKIEVAKVENVVVADFAATEVKAESFFDRVEEKVAEDYKEVKELFTRPSLA